MHGLIPLFDTIEEDIRQTKPMVRFAFSLSE